MSAFAELLVSRGLTKIAEVNEFTQAFENVPRPPTRPAYLIIDDPELQGVMVLDECGETWTAKGEVDLTDLNFESYMDFRKRTESRPN